METIEQLKQRIAELEEENKKYKKLLADKTHQFDSVRQRYHLLNRLQAKYDDKHKLHLSEMQCLELVEQNEKLQEENAKLQEQLKNAFAPKFKHHKIVYAVANTDILKGQIDVFDIYQKKYLVHFYGIDDINSFGDMWCYENELFATEAEAQKYLEEMK